MYKDDFSGLVFIIIAIIGTLTIAKVNTEFKYHETICEVPKHQYCDSLDVCITIGTYSYYHDELVVPVRYALNDNTEYYYRWIKMSESQIRNLISRVEDFSNITNFTCYTNYNSDLALEYTNNNILFIDIIIISIGIIIFSCVISRIKCHTQEYYERVD